MFLSSRTRQSADDAVSMFQPLAVAAAFNELY